MSAISKETTGKLSVTEFTHSYHDFYIEGIHNEIIAFGHYSVHFLCAGNYVIATGIWLTTTSASRKSHNQFLTFIFTLSINTVRYNPPSPIEWPYLNIDIKLFASVCAVMHNSYLYLYHRLGCLLLPSLLQFLRQAKCMQTYIVRLHCG